MFPVTSRSGSCKQHLAPLTTLRAPVVREILSCHTMSTSIATLRRLLRVLAIFLLGQSPDLQIFWWMILFQGCPRTPSNPFFVSQIRCTHSKVAKSVLGAKYRLSREKFLQPPRLQPFWSMSACEPAVDHLAKLHFITAVLLSLRYSLSCLAVISHLAIPQEVARVPNSPNHKWMSAADLHT